MRCTRSARRLGQSWPRLLPSLLACVAVLAPPAGAQPPAPAAGPVATPPGAAAPPAVAQAAPVASPPATIRLALLSQWVLNQHRPAGLTGPGPLAPEFREALERGVVDRVVFWWQRGLIQRRALVDKPIRVLPEAEAAVLGGRGEFDLRAVRGPRGGAAWIEVELAPRAERPDGVAVLEVGGELGTLHQVLEAFFVLGPGGLQELPLARRALRPSPGVPVIGAPFGRPLTEAPPVAWAGAGGVEALVARSLVDAVGNADVTTNGLADQSPFRAGEWREGDRVFLRIPAERLRAGGPALVLVWKDRTYKPDGGPDGEQRRARRPLPPVR